MKAIAKEKGQTLGQALRECGISYTTLYRIQSGQILGSRRFWENVIRWSERRIQPNDAFPELSQVAAE